MKPFAQIRANAKIDRAWMRWRHTSQPLPPLGNLIGHEVQATELALDCYQPEIFPLASSLLWKNSDNYWQMTDCVETDVNEHSEVLLQTSYFTFYWSFFASADLDTDT